MNREGFRKLAREKALTGIKHEWLAQDEDTKNGEFQENEVCRIGKGDRPAI